MLCIMDHRGTMTPNGCLLSSPRFMVQGMCMSECPRGPVWRKHIEQLRPRYRVEEDLDSGQASEMPLEYLGLGETLEERGHTSGVEEPESGADLEREKAQLDTSGHGSRKPNPRLPTGSEYGAHNPKRSNGLRSNHYFSICNRLVKRASRLVRRCCGVQVFHPSSG